MLIWNLFSTFLSLPRISLLFLSGGNDWGVYVLRRVESKEKETKRVLKVSFCQPFNQKPYVLLGTLQAPRLCCPSNSLSSIKVYLVGILRMWKYFFHRGLFSFLWERKVQNNAQQIIIFNIFVSTCHKDIVLGLGDTRTQERVKCSLSLFLSH